MLKRLLVLLLLMCLLSFTAQAAPDLRWKGPEGMALLHTTPAEPGGHGALSAYELVEVLGTVPGSKPERLRIHFFTPAGERIPAQVESALLRRWKAGDAPRIALVNNPDPEDRLHLRLKPDSRSMSHGRYYNGVVATVIRVRSDGWTQVEIQGVKGWMMGKYLLFNELPGAVPLRAPLATVVSADSKGSRLREKPGTGSNFGAYLTGTPAQVLAVTGRWAHVYMPDGFSGYLPLQDLDIPGGIRP